MAKVTAKRQVTLPAEQCSIANIEVGDDVECFADRQGVISIVKKQPGAAKGLLEGNTTIVDHVREQESLESGLND